MEKFTVSTDSTCDLYVDYMEKRRIFCAPLTFTVVEKDGAMHDYTDRFLSEEEYVGFYNRLRGGAFSRTSKLNYQAHAEHFTALAAAGAKDVLHFTISSGLSSTKEIAAKAAADVKEVYPDFCVTVVDPLTATVGQGALVDIAADMRDRGETMEKTRDFLLSLRQNIQHFIIADDLDYLRRGGRVSGMSAAIGKVLDIKPMLSFDEEGKLFVLEKNRGMRKSIRSCLEKFDTLPLDRKFDRIYIVHTDNAPAARLLEQAVLEKTGVQPRVSLMGPVIGSHLGPNGVGFGYFSTKRRNEA